MTRYRTIVADPPWRFGSAATKADARKHYATMPLEEIQALPVGEWAADDAHLWLWAVNGLMEGAYTVVRAWGFTPVTMLTWCKTQPGVGYYLRTNTEHAILASRGEPMVPDEKAIASWFIWPRGRHSAKPDAFYDLVEQVSPEPRLELARISATMNRAAKLADCHLIATVHLNEARATGTYPPFPVLRDIRGSGSLKNDADNVMFVYRQEDDIEAGEPGSVATAQLAKVRNGLLGREELRFDGNRMRFVASAPDSVAVAA